MKKLILILLFITGFMQAQTLQNPTFGNTTTNTLKIKTPATVTSVNFLPAFDSDGITISKIAPVNLPISSATQTALNLKADDNTVMHLAGSETATGNKTFTGTVSVQTPTASTHAVTKAYADGLVVGLLDDRGSYNASSNLFPTTGGSGTSGAILKGDIWYVSVAGTLGGKAVSIGDSFRALTDSPGQTSSNWSLLSANLSYVPENVANKQNSLNTDGTNTKYPTVTAVNAGLAGKQNSISLTTNYIPKASTGTTLGNSLIYDDGTNIGIGLIPASKLEVSGAIKSTDSGNPLFNWNSLFADPNNRNWDAVTNVTNFGDWDLRVSSAQGNNPSVTLLKVKSRGAFLFGTITDNGADRVQVNGNISASAGVNSNHVVIKSQLDALRPYKVYTALLTQSGTSAPVATVMENNIGAIIWSRSSVGMYKGTLAGAFTLGKTTVNVSMGAAIGVIQGNSTIANEVAIGTTNNSIIYSDGMLSNAFVEIRVYN